MTAAIGVRPASAADAAEIALLINIATHGAVSAGWAANEDSDKAYSPIEIGRAEVLRDGQSFNWRNATMAHSGAEIVGMLLGYRKGDTPAPLPAALPAFIVPILELEESATRTWFISMLGVHYAWRGQGIGSRLLDVSESKARETGADGMSLIVEDANAGARKLYERRGFAVRDKRPMVTFPDGTRPPGTDWLLMVKD